MESDCCLVCGKRLLDSEMKRHIQVDHCSPDKRTRQPDQLNLLLHCPFCPFQSECSSEIQNHVDRSHGNELLTPVKGKELPLHIGKCRIGNNKITDRLH